MKYSRCEDKLKMRIMFTQNYFGAARLTTEQRENSFFFLYYQFVKHAFGLQYAVRAEGETKVRIYFDKLPDTREKCAAFKGYVLGLNKSSRFRDNAIVIKEDQIAEVDSKLHVIMQSLDVVMGAMQFRLNDKHLEKPEGTKVRGNRTRAKEKVYKQVNRLIRNLYDGAAFNIGISTGLHGDPRSVWTDPYRHWLFMPAELEIRPHAVRQAQIEKPRACYLKVPSGTWAFARRRA
ncbi:putative phage protein [Candidatus Burkholderia humilis]|nr:putative phage protein [Candidatus Burkholderia humilis]